MTPTPTIKSITLSDGTRLEDRGEVRAPKEGDWYINRCGEAERASFTHKTESTILSPVEAPAGKIERKFSWAAEAPGIDGSYNDLDPLIDAACAVVNSMAYTDPVAESALANLATTLEPFTQAVKEERWIVERRGDSYYVLVAAELGEHTAKFCREQDAKDFAAMKNSQEGE